MDELRPLLRGDHGRDLPEPHLPARGPDGPSHQYDRPERAADYLGRLAEAGLDGRYYFSDVPFLALWGTKYLSIANPIASFFADAAAGTLPNVAFVDPRFVDEASGTSGDDHPHADIRNGEAFLNAVYQAVTTSPAWPRTVLVFNFDEWGGFFDHVPPPTAPIPAADQAAGNADGLLGFRVPCMIVSPFAPRERVSHVPFDHTSVLRMIEWRWDLPPLTVRDATANDLAEALDFKRRRFGPSNSACRRAPSERNVPSGEPGSEDGQVGAASHHGLDLRLAGVVRKPVVDDRVPAPSKLDTR